MMDLLLKCKCGSVTGVAKDVAPTLGNRLVCYCDSCRKFAEVLAGESDVLDEYGGTEIYQMPICNLRISNGINQVSCLRITENGPHRWYAECCRTPIGNTGSAALPFIGLIHSFVEDETSLERTLGPIRGFVNTKDASSVLPGDRRGSALGLIIRFLSQLLIWKLQGKNRPNPFFSPDGTAISEPLVQAD